LACCRHPGVPAQEHVCDRRLLLLRRLLDVHCHPGHSRPRQGLPQANRRRRAVHGAHGRRAPSPAASLPPAPRAWHHPPPCLPATLPPGSPRLTPLPSRPSLSLRSCACGVCSPSCSGSAPST
jgi:hypothetical protein